MQRLLRVVLYFVCGVLVVLAFLAVKNTYFDQPKWVDAPWIISPKSPRPTRLTSELILNSNGFVNGQRKDPGYLLNMSKDILFSDLDGDGAEEGVTKIETCWASCESHVAVFKLKPDWIPMIDVPETTVAGALGEIKSIEVKDKKIYVAEKTAGDFETKIFEVEYLNDQLKINKVN